MANRKLKRAREKTGELEEKKWLTLSYDRSSSIKSLRGYDPPALTVNQNLIPPEESRG